MLLEAGTRVNSHMLHYDPAGMADPNIGNNGGFIFDSPITGLIVSAVDLDFTDLLFGSSSTAYPTGDPQRGLEVGDLLYASGDDSILLQSYSQVIAGEIEQFDQLRVLTAAIVPEPTSLALFVIGLFVLGIGRMLRQ